MDLQIGDIVTVIDEDLMLFNHQGKIVEIEDDEDEDGPIGVRFSRSSRSVFGIDWRNENLIRFLEKQLRKDDDWTLENQAIQKFGTRMWHTLYEAPWPFSEQNLCMSEEHMGEIPNATKRILINYVGSIYPIDVCKDHEYLDGMCGEIWPFVDRPVSQQVAS